VIATGEERVNLTTALAKLEGDGVDQLLVEGGGELIFSLFAADLVDDLSVFVGSTIIGGRDAPTLADGDGFTEDFPALSLSDVERLDDGVLLRYDVG
jgi:2,5-diamino-6-(ribosylamino)-4(3H)-pyrimidinone 5'-phosphate reductase